ncbi:hypothetical protein OOT33_15235 [Sphingobium sp. DEHP117]|nr:hypothetical protein [Sphingobium sp. DEHP117]MDQ4421779.1 hypothetical protein [Sphingobium sp. DEHP117]
MANKTLKDGEERRGAFAPGRIRASLCRSNPKIGSARITPAERT